MEIKKVGVVGCGIMGGGIVETCAKAGYSVVASEINQQLLDKGMAAINKSLAKAVEKGKSTEADKAATLGRIKGTTNTGDFKDCDLVIEAAVENLELKKKIFADLDKICPSHAMLASNTSCLSVTDLAAVTKRPDKVLGMHFFNPVPVMRLLELVKTILVSNETIKAAESFGKAIGKTTIIAPDIPGFAVNRVHTPYMLECIKLLEDSLVTKEDLDTGMKLGYGFPMGPFELADMVGLDTILFICNAMFDELKDPRFAPPLLLKKMVTAGHFGRKSGKGFYDYTK